MILVADSSSLIALAICDSLKLLDILYKEVKVPFYVYKEITHQGKPQAQKLAEYLKEKIVAIDIADYIISDYNLGFGEFQAMCLYKKIKADVLLVDDKKARQIAKFNKIKIIGSLGVLLLAHKAKIINDIEKRINLLKNSEIYISSDLIKDVIDISRNIK
jgi:uncharacterized protein